ncbi:MAG: monomeric isocitrate dehydrogenase [Gammaproteobacteria bacterium]|jgi:monomeric isocitrate dehydrogenase
MDTLEVFVPVAATRTEKRALAPRLNQISGLRIAWLDNMKANAQELLDNVRFYLNEKHADLEVIVLSKNATAAAPETTLAYLKSCDAVVLAIAD